LSDVLRTKSELVVENALLRQQSVVLERQVKRPKFSRWDRLLLLWLANKARGWRGALLIVQPATLLRWHREGFRLYWKAKSKPPANPARVAAETVRLIKQLARENRTWGAERIRGELLKLNIRVAKRTIQKYMRRARSPHSSGQTWRTFLRNHASDIWACDFLPVTDLLFRQLYAFFIVELASRRVVHVAVTRASNAAWVAQQLREATLFRSGPKYLIRDHDSKFGTTFDRVATGAGIHILKTPIAAPKANAVCERFLRSVRQECLDHLLIFGERHLGRALTAYRDYFNHDRPHQGLLQRIPQPSEPPSRTVGRVAFIPILGGLHHTYVRAA
jgi:putative transposase